MGNSVIVLGLKEPEVHIIPPIVIMETQVSTK